MKIVDIEPMLAFLDDNHDEKDWMVNQYNADWIYSWLESQPAISPDSLVKLGRWLNKEVDEVRCHVYGNCSACHERKRIDNYCPSCGAKMGESGALMED